MDPSVRQELFDRILEDLAATDALSHSDKPEVFVVYAHDRPDEDQLAYADTVQQLIKWLHVSTQRLVSDKTPLPPCEIMASGGRSEHNIFENQLCLLPGRTSANNIIRSVNSVVLCGSPLLRKYCQADFTSQYIEAIQEAYFPGEGPQNVIRELVEQQIGRDGFHHVLTEIAFLSIRRAYDQERHGIIPLSVDDGDMGYLSSISKPDIWLNTDLSVSSLHHVFFKLLARIYHKEVVASISIDTWREAYEEICQLGSSDTAPLTHQVEQLFDKTRLLARRKLWPRLQAQDRYRIRVSGSGTREERPTQLSKEDTQCLTDLHSTDSRDEKSRIEETKGGLMPEVYNWILEHPYFKRWENSKTLGDHLLWIKGDPGKGKTMLLCGIIDHLTTQSPRNSLLAFFFCQATDNRLNGANQVLRGLIYHLAVQQPSLIRHIRLRWDGAQGRSIFEGISSWFVLSGILTSMLGDPALPQTILVVDALDECVSEPHRLLNFITSSSSCRVKWVLSSRNVSDVEEELDAAQKLALCLELNPEAISSAVHIYVRGKVDTMARRKKYDMYDSTLTQEVENFLIDNAENTFLWVSLACQKLGRLSRWNVRKSLTSEELPVGLECLYARMSDYIDEIEDSEMCHGILRVACTSFWPLTLEEMANLIEPPDSFFSLDSLACLSDVVKLCGSFLVIRKGVIYFVHQSAKEFLVKKKGATLFPRGQYDEHCEIFKRSVKLLQRCLRWNMYGLEHDGAEFDSKPAPDPDPLIQAHYSCLSWVEHLIQSVNMGELSRAFVDLENFLRTHFLNWLEALSLLQSFQHGITCILRLESFLQLAGVSEWLTALVHDAGRFMRYFKHGIQFTPLQVYTALIFSPTSSPIRRLYEKQGIDLERESNLSEYNPMRIARKPDVPVYWDASLVTLPALKSTAIESAVLALTFGPKDLLASLLNVGTLAVWESTTGRCLWTSEEDAEAIPEFVAFLPGGELILVRRDWIVRVWDPINGQCLRTIMLSRPQEEETGDIFTRPCFDIILPFGELALVWEVKQHIAIHDLKTGIQTGAFDGHTLWSGKGGVIAIAKTIKGVEVIIIWDTLSKQRLGRLVGAVQRIDAAGFVSDGRILFIDNTGTCTLWNWLTGAIERSTLNQHDFCTRPTVKFTSDGRWYLCQSDTILKLFDGQTGKPHGTIFLKEHIGKVAISPDGLKCAGAFLYGAIQVWDMTVAHDESSVQKQYEGTLSLSMSLSPDGRKVASLQKSDASILILDVASGLVETTLQYPGAVRDGDVVKFSPSGKRLLLFTSPYKYVHIWEVSNGLLTTQSRRAKLGYENIEMWDMRPDDIAFSAHEDMAATIFYNVGVWIWDLARGELIGRYPLFGFSKSLNPSICFSTDSSRLAVIGLDNGVSMVLDIHNDHDFTYSSPNGDREFIKKTVDSQFSTDIAWIRWEGRRLLWVPQDYRILSHDSYSVDAAGSTVAWLSGGSLQCMVFADREFKMKETRYLL